MKYVSLLCCVCQTTFERSKKINDVCAGSSYTVCSLNCRSKRRTTRLQVECALCKNVFLKILSQIKYTKNNFCSQSCAATYNNTHKTSGTRVSKLEKWLAKELVKSYPFLEFHFNRKDTINSELDIYVPSLKLAFELNGIFHYKPIFGVEKLSQIQINDNKKLQACLEHGIELCIINTSSMSCFKENKAQTYLTTIHNTLQRH